jgi:hypothetical protein
MSRFQRMARFAIVLAWLAGILGWQDLVVTGGPASAAAAKWPSVDCHVTASGGQPSTAPAATPSGA